MTAKTSPRPALPLTVLKKGDRARVAELQGGRTFGRRLADMGILPGTPLTVVVGGGPVILELRGQRVVIGRGMAHRVMVQPEP